jgi:serine/threonine-protein kinase ATR
MTCISEVPQPSDILPGNLYAHGSLEQVGSIGSTRSGQQETRWWSQAWQGVRGDEMEQRLLRVDSILSSIPRELVARAALQCKAFARSLMSFEGQIFDLKANDAAEADLQPYYEHLHEIYANLDEPDGMEGISTLVLSPSLEHKIRQHESTGRWTSAQSCWEVKLQSNPNNLDYHIGLLRCLRNLGHYG